MKVRRSRRAAGLQSTDYDHEITLIDDEQDPTLRPVSSEAGGVITANTSTYLLSDDNGDAYDLEEGHTSGAHQHQQQQQQQEEGEEILPRQDNSANGHKDSQLHPGETNEQTNPPETTIQPSIDIQVPTPQDATEYIQNGNYQSHRVMPRKNREKRETVIDILYENERGGFLCGVALFSGAALGGFDPTPWTNAYHKASPSNIHNAQVPDPSWEWVWPEWRVNHQDGMDEGGWEYSFAFSKKSFSWHGPTWYSSFVRRRAWIRRRAKKRPEDVSKDAYMLNVTDYFAVRPSSIISNRTAGSVACSRVPSKSSLTQASSTGFSHGRPDIDDMDMLLRVLRYARIDRERREAIENYLEHAIDLAELQREMHEIMSLFIFQQSRRQLLSYLMQQHDEVTKEYEIDKSLELKLRKEALDAAVRHAEEEVCRLAYWSDVKQMAESGELRDVIDECGGLTDGWQGLDKSAPAPPRSGKMPEQ